MMFGGPSDIPPAAIDALMRQRSAMQTPDYTFGTQDNRPALRYGQKKVDAQDPYYRLIQQLILEKYIKQIPQGMNVGGMNSGL